MKICETAKPSFDDGSEYKICDKEGEEVKSYDKKGEEKISPVHKAPVQRHHFRRPLQLMGLKNHLGICK